MNSTDRPKSFKRRWPFRVGVACVVLPFLALVIHYTNIFHPILFGDESKLDIAAIQNGIREGMTFSLWCLPIMFVGLVFMAIGAVRKP